jgi:hypothetical protein
VQQQASSSPSTLSGIIFFTFIALAIAKHFQK